MLVFKSSVLQLEECYNYKVVQLEFLRQLYFKLSFKIFFSG